MKLILANNQTEKFRQFYKELQQKSEVPFDYCGYESLLFVFDTEASQPISLLVNGQNSIAEYSGVYLNGYLDTYELAVTTAICCKASGIPFVNHELTTAPSLSKLSGYAKLAAAGVSIPRTIAGSKTAILQAHSQAEGLQFPLVLKRADADRGIDNFKVNSFAEVEELLEEHPPRSLWILQEYVDNNGFYLLSYYGQKPKFCIFRSLEARPDGDARKAHMFKPKGGANASLVPLNEVPPRLADTALRAMQAMDRQIGSVDCLYDSKTDSVHVLEVNYNPQLVTIETFKETRIAAFLEGLAEL